MLRAWPGHNGTGAGRVSVPILPRPAENILDILTWVS